MSGWWAVSYVVLWALVIFLCLVVVALARQVGVLHMRLGPRGALEVDDEGPPLGEAPEPVDVLDAHGRPATIGGPGAWRFILFVSPNCPMCRQILPSLPVVARAGGMQAVLISDGAAGEATEDGAVPRGPVDMAVVFDGAVGSLYRVPGTPYAVILDALGVVRAKGTANNLEQLEGLVDSARRRARQDDASSSSQAPAAGAR